MIIPFDIPVHSPEPTLEDFKPPFADYDDLTPFQSEPFPSHSEHYIRIRQFFNPFLHFIPEQTNFLKDNPGTPRKYRRPTNMFNLGNLLTPTPLQPFDADKDDVTDWLNAFEAISEGSRWTKEQRCAFLPLFLGSTAKHWFTVAKATAGGEALAWDAVRRNFLTTFTRPDKDKKKASKEHRQRNQKPTETIDDYVYGCLDLASKADRAMSEPKKIKAILRGLLPRFFDHTYMKPFETTTELIAHLHMLEDASYVFDRETTPSTTGELQEVKKMLQNLTTLQTNNFSAQPRQDFTPTPSAPPPSPQQQHNRTPYARPPPDRHASTRTNDGKLVCFNCRVAGHLASQCRRAAYCTFCRRDGHANNVCRNNPSKQAQASGNLQGRTQ